MHKLTLLIFLTVLSTDTLFFSLSAQASEAKFTNVLTEHRKVQLIHMVKQDCGSCHGMTLKGGLGPALLPEDVKSKPVEFLQNTILYGRTGTAMPPWSTILTEQEVRWISLGLQQGIFVNKK